MARPKQCKFYSTIYMDVAKDLQNDPKTMIRVRCTDKADAEEARFEFYNFRKAANAEGLIEHYPELNAALVTIKQVGDEWFMVVQHKDWTPRAMAIQAALEEARKQKGQA